jgi:hypothetical protein
VTCSSARYLLLAGFVGVAASSISGSDLLGVLAAVVAVAAMAAVERFGSGRWSADSCALPDATPPQQTTSADRTAEGRTAEDRSAQPG